LPITGVARAHLPEVLQCEDIERGYPQTYRDSRLQASR
jgi:hypothetical protein